MEQRLSENIKTIYRRISHSAMRAGREPNEVRLIAVTKKVAADAVVSALEIGQRDFGESRVQEFREKLEEIRGMLAAPQGVKTLRGYRPRWHLIGHLQKNKTKMAVELFDLIHSVDSEELAEALDKSAGKINKVQRILIQVKLSDEESKYGIEKENVYELLRLVGIMKNLKVEGVMTIPPYFEDPGEVRGYFRELREIRDRAETKGFSLPELSMGMSHDFEVAVEEGATMVRVGTAIFGERGKEQA
ncbi:MAG: YggS family pyridoxal phosphate-dependent enzyme [Nitrospiraceae bacterium]|nr:YggS family pyridoxal phosphate-dependent enzyme [Nitrospiraceae bacterium]